MANELANLIKSGIKTATTSAYELYESDDPVPKVGQYTIILDGNNLPVCVVKDVIVEIIQYDLISAEHAYHEGEGDRSYQYWRKIHDEFFKNAYLEADKTFTPQIKCLCEVFEVIN
ncbi:ASCH domain-containing protein [Lactobacillus sp. S2-2]|nr:ASCH domain-containing protein [Lactobacillus sp. S2-2]